jgi:hypothetical protein
VSVPLRVVALALVATSAAPPPAALVLRQSDVGRAFSGQGAPVSNAEAARGGPPGLEARLVRWGRIGGYEVDFTRAAGAATLQDGPLAIRSSASVYRTDRGARAAFTYATRRLVPAGDVPLALGFSVGEQARQWVSQGPSAVGAILQYVLVWREGGVVASLVLTGRVGVVSAFDVAPLARRQEARIRAALRSGR